MRRRFCFVLSLGLLAGFVTAPPAAAAEPRDTEHPHVARRVLVGALPGQEARAAQSIAARGGEVLEYQAPGDLFMVQTPGRVPDFVAGLRGAAGVRFAEPDYLVSIDQVPNDPRWPDLWGLQRIGMPAAWDVHTGSDGVVVGIIDTGVDYTHEDLVGQMWTNPLDPPNGLDDDANGFVDDTYGLDCVNNDGNPIDDHDHGTHVAGTIGGAANNGTGVAGINWDVAIMALKFLSAAGTGSVSDAVQCLDYARIHGAVLTSNSWGGGGYSQAMRDAIARSMSANMLFVAAAGNDASNSDLSPHYPSSYDLDNIVAVAATDANDALASFSNYGAYTADLGAPGVGIWSTVRNNGYASFNGTSMATPHVAGAAALLVARYPALATDWRGLRDRLFGSVEPTPALSGKVATGGRLDVARAIEMDTAPPGATGLAVTGAGRQYLDLSWTAPSEAGASGGAVSSYHLSYAPSGSGAWASAPAPSPAAPGTSQTQRIQGLRPATAYDVRLVAIDNAGNTSTAMTSASTTAGVVVFEDDMEGGSGKWTAQAPWAITGERPHSGSGSWSDSPNTNSRDLATMSITSASFSLAAFAQPQVSFWHRYSLEPGFDYAYLDISTNGGSTWTRLLQFNGHTPRFEAMTYGLASYAGATNVKIRFRLAMDWFVNYDGWFVDDVLVTGEGADTTPPAPPTGMSASNAGTGGTLDLSWTANGEGDLAGYNVYRSTDPAAPKPWTRVNGSLLVGTSTSDTGLSNGTTYWYYVTAVDTGSNESDPSTEASATPSDVTAPPPPTGLTAAAGNAQVSLTWSGPGDAVGYNVYRSTVSEGGPWARVNGSLVGPTTYTDTSVANGSTYWYQVTAVDASSNESGPSNVVSATPSAVPVAQSFFPSGVTVTKGTSLGDPVSNLGADDTSFFRVASKKQGRNKHVVDCYGSTTIDPGTPKELTIDYVGSNTLSATQTVYVFNFVTSSWVQLAPSSLVGTADVGVTWSTASPSSFISAALEVRVRVAANTTSSFTSRGDLIRIAVTY